MKHVIGLLLATFSVSALAGGFSSLAAPTGIDVVSVGTTGFMLYGSFGNAAGCTVSDAIFVKTTHPQYKELYTLALTAFASGKRLIAYAGGCEPVEWYSAPSVTYNVVLDSGAIYIRE